VVVDRRLNAKRARLCRKRSGRLGSLRCSTSSSGVEFQWLGVEDVAREEGHNKAKAVFRLFGRKLKAMGFEDLVPEEIVREGVKADEILKLIEEDEDLGVLVLGASKDPSGPGPLVSTLAGGRLAGTFPVPITVVPGHLSIEEILALA
jgi:nucleotide-binding universal stress UspA family protein